MEKKLRRKKAGLCSGTKCVQSESNKEINVSGMWNSNDQSQCSVYLGAYDDDFVGGV